MQIKTLTLYSHNLSQQIAFYAQGLGLPLLEQSPQRASFKIGNSILTFRHGTNFSPYHFAVNIPCNKINDALIWLKQRVEILKDGNSEIQDFEFWNAKAIYFYDKDNNIVELIARNNLNNESTAAFNAQSFLELSEIGLAVNHIQETWEQLKAIANVKLYDGNFERFCAIGDENGLFICINKNIKTWFPTGDRAHASEFDIEIVQDQSLYNIRFRGGKIISLT